jgi:hypothetical protein
MSFEKGAARNEMNWPVVISPPTAVRASSACVNITMAAGHPASTDALGRDGAALSQRARR